MAQYFISGVSNGTRNFQVSGSGNTYRRNANSGSGGGKDSGNKNIANWNGGGGRNSGGSYDNFNKDRSGGNDKARLDFHNSDINRKSGISAGRVYTRAGGGSKTMLQSKDRKVIEFDSNSDMNNFGDSKLYENGFKKDRISRNKNEVLDLIPRSRSRIYDMTIDYNSRLVYYTNMSCSCIMAVRFDGRNAGVVVSEEEPRFLSMASRAGYLFWTNKGKRLERSALDGSFRMTLINTGVGRLGPIEVDDDMAPPTSPLRGRVYWIDLELQRIESAYLDGGDRRIIVRDTGQPQAAGLVVIGDWLLWATKNSTVEKASIINGNDREVIYSGSSPIATLTSTKYRRRTVSILNKNYEGVDVQYSGDVYNKYGFCPTNTCSYFCLAEHSQSFKKNDAPDPKWRCSCPIAMLLKDDGKTCVEPVPCKLNEFKCLSSGDCIPAHYQCDGHLDCPDNTDEANCIKIAKKPVETKESCEFNGKLLCPDFNECIETDMICDGKIDCANGSDESSCDKEEASDPPSKDKLDGPNGYAIGIGMSAVSVVAITLFVLLACVCRQKSRKLATAFPDDVVMVAQAAAANSLGGSYSLPDSNSLLLKSTDLSVDGSQVFLGEDNNDNAVVTDGKYLKKVSKKSINDHRPLSKRLLNQEKSVSRNRDLDSVTSTNTTSLFYDETSNVYNGTHASSLFYDRGNITGASSTSGSVMTGRPVFDPPPSPITDRSASYNFSLNENSTSRAKRRTGTRSKDVNRTYLTNFSKQSGDISNNLSDKRSNRSNKRRRHTHRRRFIPTSCSSTADEIITSDEFPQQVAPPPPPTPLSDFLYSRNSFRSPDFSYPPSPSTTRSHYPPPPPSSFRCLNEEDEEDDDVSYMSSDDDVGNVDDKIIEKRSAPMEPKIYDHDNNNNIKNESNAFNIGDATKVVT